MFYIPRVARRVFSGEIGIICFITNDYTGVEHALTRSRNADCHLSYALGTTVETISTPKLIE